MSLTPAERETVITFNDAEETAEVYTHQRPVITKLKKNPAATLIDEGVFETTPWAHFQIPKQFVSFRGKARKATRTTGGGFASRIPVQEHEL
jgi:hypothetical protein